MSRRILVKVSPGGEITIEAEGFQGKGCTEATKAIEDALGSRTVQRIKPEFHRQPIGTQLQIASNGGGES